METSAEGATGGGEESYGAAKAAFIGSTRARAIPEWVRRRRQGLAKAAANLFVAQVLNHLQVSIVAGWPS